jgi:hypothetical protein
MTALLTTVFPTQEEWRKPASGHAWGDRPARIARTRGRLAVAFLVLVRRAANRASPLRKAQEERAATAAVTSATLRGGWRAVTRAAKQTGMEGGTDVTDYAEAGEGVQALLQDLERLVAAIGREVEAYSNRVSCRSAVPEATAPNASVPEPLPAATRKLFLSALADVDGGDGEQPGAACEGEAACVYTSGTE